MSFAPIEESRSLGEPITLFLFVFGEGPLDFYAYTDAEQVIFHEGREYQPVPIDRSAITASGTLDKANTTIKMPSEEGLPELFRSYPPSGVVYLTIKQGHAGDPDEAFLVQWTGRVLSSGREAGEATLVCEPVSSSLRRPGLRRNWQYGCPHLLYDSECRANQIAATVTTTATGFDSSLVNLPDGWNGSFDADKFVNGVIQWTSETGRVEKRRILRILSSRNVVVAGAVRNLAIGQTVEVRLGCNHTLDDCRDLHNNAPNFGGQPWIPLDNPVGLRNKYY